MRVEDRLIARFQSSGQNADFLLVAPGHSFDRLLEQEVRLRHSPVLGIHRASEQQGASYQTKCPEADHVKPFHFRGRRYDHRGLPLISPPLTRAGPVETAVPPQDGRQGPSKSVSLSRDRATVPIEGIWCEKIRSCSYKGERRASGHVRYAAIATAAQRNDAMYQN